jgi:hypothetical protein
MRLRLAPVEYKMCTTADCGSSYEGDRCPHCRAAFDPTLGRKELADRLILVDVDPAIYEQTHRCRCPVCKNLFDLRAEEVIVRAQCRHCEQPLFSRAQLQTMWGAAETLLQRARKLERARRRLVACPHCEQPIALASWCPLAYTVPHAPEISGLPQNPIVVWVRTFHSGASFEELQKEAPDEAGRAAHEEMTSTSDEEPTDAE